MKKVLITFTVIIAVIGGGFAIGSTIVSVLMSGIVASNSDECEENGATTSINIDDKGREENGKRIATEIRKEFPEATWQGLSGMNGNFDQESRMSPKAIERLNDSLSGHGIAQWTGGRTTALMNFAKDKGKDWADLGLQIEFLIHELKTTEKGAQLALKATSVEEATTLWQIKFERAGTPVMGNRLNFANQWFSLLGTSDPASSSAMGNASESAIDSLECSSGSAEGGEILDIAKSWLGWFYYIQVHPSPDLGTDFINPQKSGGTDCSGYVWLVLNKAGYKVPPRMGWFTGTMTSDARGGHQYLKEVSESSADAGDVVIVNQGVGIGNNGHTAILLEKWHGRDTKIIEQGGNGESVNTGTFGSSFLSLLNGGDVCLARPIKK